MAAPYAFAAPDAAAGTGTQTSGNPTQASTANDVNSVINTPISDVRVPKSVIEAKAAKEEAARKAKEEAAKAEAAAALSAEADLLDTAPLAEIAGTEVAESLVKGAHTNADRLWIAQNASALADAGAYNHAKLLRLAAQEDEAVAFVRGYADAYPAEKATEDEEDDEEKTDENKGSASSAESGKSSSGDDDKDSNGSASSDAEDSASDDTKDDASSETEDTKAPRLYQWDTRWGYTVYSSSAFGLSGCGPTSLAIVYQGLTGKTDRSPYDMGVLAKDLGCMDPYTGTPTYFFPTASEALGLTCNSIDDSEEALRAAFDAGCLVVANVGHGFFSQGDGHYLVLTGFDEDGKLKMNDPYSAVNSGKTWDVSFILGETMSLFSFSA